MQRFICSVLTLWPSRWHVRDWASRVSSSFRFPFPGFRDARQLLSGLLFSNLLTEAINSWTRDARYRGVRKKHGIKMTVLHIAGSLSTAVYRLAVFSVSTLYHRKQFACFMHTVKKCSSVVIKVSNLEIPAPFLDPESRDYPRSNPWLSGLKNCSKFRLQKDLFAI